MRRVENFKDKYFLLGDPAIWILEGPFGGDFLSNVAIIGWNAVLGVIFNCRAFI